MSESERPATGASGGDDAEKCARYERAERFFYGATNGQHANYGLYDWMQAFAESELAALAAENARLKARCEGLEAALRKIVSPHKNDPSFYDIAREALDAAR